MCAQSMIAAPRHPPMSSAAPFASQAQSFTQHWDILNSHAPPSTASSNTYGGMSTRTPYNTGLDGYVNRWLADTASQTRARSVPAAKVAPEKKMPSTSFDQYRITHPQHAVANYAASKSTAPRSLYEPPHRSLSPESEDRQNATSGQNGMDGIEKGPIASFLQIPDTINDSKGSLAEFAAQITCLFWFEEASTLSRVENALGAAAVVPLPTEANPTVGFRKWVTTLLSTTQVSQNVILLALLFVYRLKKITCNVKGKAGSEYRLLTVALMLGNKFLDDNTYTNKTWADVSGISVTEIHVMEVEFLSNMKYDLYTSRKQWDDWQKLLGRFAAYFDKASRAYPAMPTPMSMATSHLSGHPALPFTPPSEQLSPPHMAAQRISVPQRQLPNPLPVYNMATNIPQPAARPTDELRASDLRAAGSRPASRKRSLDEPMFALPHKQARTTGPSNDTSAAHYLPTISPQEHPPPKLPIPANTLPSALNTTSMYAPSYPTTVPPSTSQIMLPAPVVFSSEQLWQPPSQPPSSSMASGGPTLPSLLAANASQTLQPVAQPGSQNVSPTNTSFPPPQPHQSAHSPSGYLMYRNSPYRPVRQVNTLLAPPQSMAALQSPLQHMSQQPTYYQPLAKGPIEPRQGMVPYLTPRQFQMAPMDSSRQMPPLDYRYFAQR